MDRAAIIITSRTKDHPDFNDVPGVDNDGQQVYTFFHNAGYAVQLVRDESAAQVKAVVDDVVAQLPAGSLLMVYYAGHGHVVNGQHVLICPKATRKRLQTFHEVIQVEDLRLATDVKGLHRAIILDCCRDSPYRNVTRGAGGFSGLQDERALRDIGRCEAGRPVDEHELDHGASWHLMCGCSKDQVAPEIPRQRRGLFTTAFVDEVRMQAEAGAVRLDQALCVNIGKRMAALAAENEMEDFPTPWHEGSGELPVILGEAAGGAAAAQQRASTYSGGAAPALQPAGPAGSLGRQGTTSAPAGGLATSSGGAAMSRARGAEVEARMEAARLESSIAWLRRGRALYFIVGGTSLLLILFMLMFTPVVAEGGGPGVEAAAHVPWITVLIPLLAFGWIGWALGAAIRKRERARATHLEEPARWAGVGAAAATSDAAKLEASAKLLGRVQKGFYIAGGVAIFFYGSFFFLMFLIAEGKGVQDDAIAVLSVVLLVPAASFFGVGYGFNGAIRRRKAARVQCLKEAAEQGDAAAQSALGYCYENAEGAVRDWPLAMRWYRKSAERGHAAGEYRLGLCHYFGRGTAKDINEAVQWYRKAAEQGYAGAQGALGDCYRKGEGVAADKAAAVAWYRKAAAQDEMQAMFQLGECYELGEGVEASRAEAQEWYYKAGRAGNKEARVRAKRLAR